MSSPDESVSDRSLEDIENDRWDEAPGDASAVMRSVHGLRRQPVGSLDTEGLRVLLSQQVGTETLLPLALAKLREQPLAEGDFYPGDLLAAVLKIGDDYWATHPDQRAEVASIAAGVDQDDPEFETASDLPELIKGFASP